MIRNIIRTAVAVLSRTAYEDGRRDGAGLVPRRELEQARADLESCRGPAVDLAEALSSPVIRMPGDGRLVTVDQTLALSLRAARMLRKQLDEARAELEAAKADRDRILRELGANLGNAPEPGEIKRRVSELYARAEKAEAALFAANSEKELLALRQPTAAEMIAYLDGVADPPFGWSTIRRCVDCNEPVAGGPTRCIVCAVKAEVRSSQRRPSEAALASQPAAYPWSDEAVERATRAAIAERDRLGDEERAWVEGAPKFAVSSRIVRAALATLAPPPQAAPVPPVGSSTPSGSENHQ